MTKVQLIRVRLADDTTLELPENENVQVVTDGPGETQQEGWVRLNADKTPALFGKLAKVRAAALAQGQHLVTYRGILLIEAARRV